MTTVITGSVSELTKNSSASTAARPTARKLVLPGSGTRAEFEAAVRSIGVDPATLPTMIALPTNEAVLNALRSSRCVAALSEMVVAPFLATGELVQLPIELPQRHFSLLHHKERRLSAAARRFEAEITEA